MTTSTSTVDEINQLFRLRRSGFAYNPTQDVSKQDITALFEAARWAPSGGNHQPWRYVYAVKSSNPKGYARLLNLLNENNREWAQHAPLLVLSGAVTTRVNTHGEKINSPAALHDLGMANLSISLEAVHRGLMSHMIGGYNKDAARELLPDDAQPMVMMAIGYPGDHSLLSENSLAKDTAPRTRKLIDEFVTTA